MVIAVIAVGMMQHSLIEIILMIAVRNKWVPTALVSACTGDWSALGGIMCVHFQHMFIIMSLVQRMEVAIMQIVGMAVMRKRDVPTMLSMDVGMLFVSGMAHQKLLSKDGTTDFLS
jgi:hypothetical protein